MIDGQEARFTPLLVAGPGYKTTIEPTEECEEQEIFSSYVFDVPLPESGEITATPGNQSGIVLDAADPLSDDGATVFYPREGEGAFEVSVVRPGRDAAVGEARE